jgi:hypothetical protein
VSTRVTVRLKENAPGSVGSTADFNEITISPGETRTLPLTWDRVDLVPDYFVPGDVELCVEADRDGVPGVQAEDCTTVTVGGALYTIESTTSASNASGGGSSSTVGSTDGDVTAVAYSLSFSANDNSSGNPPQSARLEIGGTEVLRYQLGEVGDGDYNDDVAVSSWKPGTNTVNLGASYSGGVELVVDDADATVSPP